MSGSVLARIILCLGLLLLPSLAHGQTTSILPPAETTFVDSNGVPLANGFVYFYVPGTTTAKTTWQDPNGLVANSNPVQLNSAGRAIIYGSGQYREIVQDQFGNTIWDQLTQDSISVARGALGTMAQQNANAVNITGGTISGVTLTGLAGTRTVLTVATTFYVTTGGSDSSGQGTQALPWATPLGAYQNIQKTYDAGGQQITISIADGTYASSNQLHGPIVGQSTPVIFEGDLVTPANVLLQPTPGTGYAFSVQGGAQVEVEGMEFDQTNNSGSNGNDTMSISHGSYIALGPDLIFGNNLVPWNDISVNGTLDILTGSDYTISKSQVQATGTWGSGSNSIALSSGAGIKQYMGVSGSNIPRGAYVLTGAGTSTIGLGYVGGSPVTATTGSGSGALLTFSYGGQTHIDVGTGGLVEYLTNGDPNFALTITINGYPLYGSGFIYASQLSQIIMQAINITPFTVTGAANAVPFFVKSNSIIDTESQGVPYLAGSIGDVATQNIQSAAGSTTLLCGTGTANIRVGNVVTFYEAPSATYSSGVSTITIAGSSHIAAGWQVDAPGIPSGTVVSNIVGTSVTLSHQTTAAYGGAVYFKDYGSILPVGTYVTAIQDGSHVTLSQPALASITDAGWFGGFVLSGGQYQ